MCRLYPTVGALHSLKVVRARQGAAVRFIRHALFFLTVLVPLDCTIRKLQLNPSSFMFAGHQASTPLRTAILLGGDGNKY